MRGKDVLTHITNSFRREGYSAAKPVDLSDFSINNIRPNLPTPMARAADIARTRVFRSRGGYLISDAGQFRVTFNAKGYHVTPTRSDTSGFTKEKETVLAETYTGFLNLTKDAKPHRRTLRRPGYSKHNPLTHFATPDGIHDGHQLFGAAHIASTRRNGDKGYLRTGDNILLDVTAFQRTYTPENVVYDVGYAGKTSKTSAEEQRIRNIVRRARNYLNKLGKTTAEA